MREAVYFIYIFVIVTSVVTCASVLDNLHYEGCYDSGFSLRQKYHHHINALNLTKCVQKCLALKTRFAGVETSDNFCYCGGDIAEESIHRDDSLCNVPCPDDTNRSCGGDWLLSLYDILGASTPDTSGNIDMLLGISTGVRLYHSSGQYDTLLTTTEWVYAVDYHFSKSLIFVYSKSKILKAPMESGKQSGSSTVPPIAGTLVKDVSSCDGFAVDWVHDRIYWADCGRNGVTIMAMGLDGNADETVLSRLDLTGKIIKRMEIDPYKGMLFWTADGVIQSCDTNGEGFATNVSKADVSVRALALNLEQRRVYYVGALNQTISLFSMDYSGDDEVEHFSIAQLRSVYGLSILDNNVYWVNYANVRDVIYQAPLNYTGINDVKMIQTIDRAVWHMRVMHPSLQKRPKIDPCSDKGCSYHCVARGTSSGKCECPPGQTLQLDGVSCRSHAGSSFTGHVAYKGCYSSITLSTSSRSLGHLLNPFLADDCFRLCSGNGFTHAGLDSLNSICYCGEGMLSQISKAEDTQCKPCKDDANRYCGGILKISLYEIDGNTIANSVTPGLDEIHFDEEPLILLAGHGGIYMYNTTKSTDNLKLLISMVHTVDALDYHLKRKEGFAIWNEVIYRFPLFENHDVEPYEVEEFADVNRCPTFTVDWVHDLIYWPDCYHHTIRSKYIQSLRYIEDVIVRVPDGAWAMDMAVDPYKGLLFWTNGATLMSCRVDGRELKKVVPEFPVNRVSSLSLDLAAERVYFAGADKKNKNTSRLYYATYNGLVSYSLQFHEYEDGSHISNFGIFNYHIYSIIDGDNGTSMLLSTQLEHVQRPNIYLRDRDIEVDRLKLIHSRLQAPGKEDACTSRNCSHLCVMEGSLPQCHCPRYYALEPDDTTCLVNPGFDEEEPLLVKGAFGLIMVLFVVLGAGVLLCICDKLWSQLHPTVVSLSIPGASKTSFTGHRMQDVEHLI